ncbi:MAG TPA: hypothetical protein VF618_28570 [Thermoanaerobaculia bacterium]
MPLTPAAIEALERARELPPLSTAAYLEWLTLMSENVEPSRETFDREKPFEL